MKESSRRRSIAHRPLIFASLTNWLSRNASVVFEPVKFPWIGTFHTRALVRHIRNVGALRCIVDTDGTSGRTIIFEAKQRPAMAGQELLAALLRKSYGWDKGSSRWAISPWSEQNGLIRCARRDSTTIACGFRLWIKHNIWRLLRRFISANSTSSPRKLLPKMSWAMKPNGVSFECPGDPSRSLRLSKTFKSLSATCQSSVICLGTQLWRPGDGRKTFKLKIRGTTVANHPVKNLPH